MLSFHRNRVEHIPPPANHKKRGSVSVVVFLYFSVPKQLEAHFIRWNSLG